MYWTVTRRIALGFFVILGLMTVLAVAGVLALRGATRAYDTALAQNRDILLPALEAESFTHEANNEFLRYLLDESPRWLRAQDSVAALARQSLQNLRAEASGTGVEGTWTEALTLHDRWQSDVQTAARLIAAGNRAEGTRLWAQTVRPLKLQLRDAVDHAIVEIRQHTDTVVDGARSAASRNVSLLFIGASLILLIGIITAVLLNRAVGGALHETTVVLAATAAEILASTTQQASGTSESMAAVTETVTTVDEVARTAEEAMQRAREMADTARRAVEIGASGRQAVKESVAAMDRVHEQVESISSSILALAEQAQAIGELMTTVNEIAEQTNLLALNAAIEAARAGEQGRGFAIVAGEVRNLAEQSKTATVQVRQILGEIQRATNAAVMTTEEGTRRVGAGMEQLNTAGDTIGALADAVAEAAQTSAQIVASAGQQSMGMSQIRQAIIHIHEATQQSVTSTKQAEQAAHELNRLGSTLLELVGGNGRVVRRT